MTAVLNVINTFYILENMLECLSPVKFSLDKNSSRSPCAHPTEPLDFAEHTLGNSALGHGVL